VGKYPHFGEALKIQNWELPYVRVTNAGDEVRSLGSKYWCEENRS
jgi:hypothetical protein